MELYSKNSIYEKKCGAQNERVQMKRCEITDIKFRLLSKHLFQRTQQHGGCTKPLSNAKFM